MKEKNECIYTYTSIYTHICIYLYAHTYMYMLMHNHVLMNFGKFSTDVLTIFLAPCAIFEPVGFPRSHLDDDLS